MGNFSKNFLQKIRAKLKCTGRDFKILSVYLTPQEFLCLIEAGYKEQIGVWDKKEAKEREKQSIERARKEVKSGRSNPTWRYFHNTKLHPPIERHALFWHYRSRHE
jgi:hypothetical protein